MATTAVGALSTEALDCFEFDPVPRAMPWSSRRSGGATDDPDLQLYVAWKVGLVTAPWPHGLCTRLNGSAWITQSEATASRMDLGCMTWQLRQLNNGGSLVQDRNFAEARYFNHASGIRAGMALLKVRAISCGSIFVAKPIPASRNSGFGPPLIPNPTLISAATMQSSNIPTMGQRKEIRCRYANSPNPMASEMGKIQR